MTRKKYNLLDLIAEENMTDSVRALLEIEGSVLTTDVSGCDHEMEGHNQDSRFLVYDHGNGVGFGAVQYLYVIDGHLIAAVWFGGDELQHFSFTFNSRESLVLVPPSPQVDPCNQQFDEHLVVSKIEEFWVASKAK